MKNKPKSPNVWKKITRQVGLYLYKPSGQLFGRPRFRGRIVERKLDTTDLAFAKRNLADFRPDLERT